MSMRPLPRWPAHHHVIFDCDATLATIEGIDELASDHPEGDVVAELTDAAMRGDVPLDDVYERRLEMIKPAASAVKAIHHRYRRTVTPGAKEVIAHLRRLGHAVSVVSGGLAGPVREFATFLGVDPDNVHAVETRHDVLSGKWWEPGPSDHEFAGLDDSPLTTSDGKLEVIGEILDAHDGRSMLVGDGVSDLAAQHIVDTFVGYGGVSHRISVESEADVYLRSPTLVPVLALAAGTVGRAVAVDTWTDGSALFDEAFAAAERGELTFRRAEDAERFNTAFDPSGADRLTPAPTNPGTRT